MITESPMLLEHATLFPLSMQHRLITTRVEEKDEPEVLRFLAERALHNVVMAGLIRDNGIESEFNRGTFYGCRDTAGELKGVALIGHAVFFDARCDEAVQQFAKVAQQSALTHMLMAEQESIERFWKCYAPKGQPQRRVCREVLFELTKAMTQFEEVDGLRLATIDDLAHVMPVHAAMAFEESGVNPLQIDPEGFRQRCQRRIEERRTWVFVEAGQLIFKADVISDTREVIYLEGIYVHPDYRRKGHGSRCLAQLSRHLLSQTSAISLLVNEERQEAQRFFRKLGFVSRGFYDTIFLCTQSERL